MIIYLKLHGYMHAKSPEINICVNIINGIFRKLANDQVGKASCQLENLYSRSYLTVARVT